MYNRRSEINLCICTICLLYSNPHNTILHPHTFHPSIPTLILSSFLCNLYLYLDLRRAFSVNNSFFMIRSCVCVCELEMELVLNLEPLLLPLPYVASVLALLFFEFLFISRLEGVEVAIAFPTTPHLSMRLPILLLSCAYDGLL